MEKIRIRQMVITAFITALVTLFTKGVFWIFVVGFSFSFLFYQYLIPKIMKIGKEEKEK